MYTTIANLDQRRYSGSSPTVTMPNDPRRQLTVPIQPTYRSTSPSPQSAPPVSSNNHRRSRSSIDDNTTSSTFQPKFIPPTRKKSLPIASRSTHPLQLEIDRLTAICEEHERAIRSSLSTIKHHVMTNMPDVFEKVNNIDIDAEAITANIQKTLSTYIPPFQSNLNRIKSDRSHDVEIMKQRTTPWKDIVLEFKSSLIDASSSSTSTKSTKHLDKAGKLIGIPGINDNEDESESAALTRISMWVEELDMYLSSEIVRVKERINSKTSKRQRLIRLITFLLYAAVFLIILLFVGLLVHQSYERFGNSAKNPTSSYFYFIHFGKPTKTPI